MSVFLFLGIVHHDASTLWLLYISYNTARPATAAIADKHKRVVKANVSIILILFLDAAKVGILSETAKGLGGKNLQPQTSVGLGWRLIVAASCLRMVAGEAIAWNPRDQIAVVFLSK